MTQIGMRSWWRLAAGIYAAGTAAYLLGGATVHGRQTSLQLLSRGVAFVAAAAGVGALVSWLLLRRELDSGERSLVPIGRVWLYCGVGWVLAAPVALLLQRESRWAPLMMVVAAGLLAVSLFQFQAGWGTTGTASAQTSGVVSGAAELALPVSPFGLLTYSNAGIWLALAIAACVEGAAVPFAMRELLVAGVLVAAGVFVFAWRSMAGGSIQAFSSERAGARLGFSVVLAVVVSMMAVMMQLPDDSAGDGAGVAAAKEADDQRLAADGREKEAGAGAGYKGIVLWSPPKKKEKIVAPRVLTAAEMAEAKQRPMVIPFDGPYWYYQSPHDSPGRNPHVAHGDPVIENIRSVNLMPLVMEAHQKLAAEVDLSCCRAIEMDVRNADNHPGGIVMGVVLTDSRLKGRPSLALGGQVLPTSETGRFAVKAGAVADSLRYAIPERRAIGRFDEIKVLYFPASERGVVGPKVGIEQFVLLPR